MYSPENTHNGFIIGCMDTCPASISSAAQILLHIHAEREPEFVCLDSNWNPVLSVLTAGERDRVSSSSTILWGSKILA